MILIKLGGSVITDKSRPLSASRPKIAAMARAIARIKEPAVIVHGGGSFGHYWSVKYDMHTAERDYDPKGVSVVKNSMVQLNLIILEELLRGGLRPYAMAPSGFMAGPRPIPSRVREVADIAAASEMTPVTYGDAVWYGDGSKTYILSGDKIMSHMARISRPRLCIFALAEDGLYTDMESKRLVERVPAGAGRTAASKLTSPGSGAMDVTGGMARKVAEAARIAGYGIQVALVNGNRPKRILDAATSSKGFRGTLFEADTAAKDGKRKKSKRTASKSKERRRIK